jgi:maltose/moltooligosaccharide transporter
MIAANKPVSHKPLFNFWQIWNMSFGFLGIQFGWNLQMSNMSAIYEYLGAKPDQIPILWLAAPLTGLIVQPIIGHLSDHTWNRLGRRRPYFLTGAILSSIALVIMPTCSVLWMAAGLLWVLDASINISMEPFRAFIADMLPESQYTRGFAMQSVMIGIGASIASALPWLLSNLFHVSRATSASQAIPFSVRFSFWIGAAAFLGAVIWTVVTTKEYPPVVKRGEVTEKRGGLVPEVLLALRNMPTTMKQLALVQFCTWLGLFWMWQYFGVAVAHNVFGADTPQSPRYTEGIEWGGICFSFYSVVTFFYAVALPSIAQRFGPRMTHIFSLLCGAAGLASVMFIHNPYMLLLSMLGVGIAWSSILSMPYAILAGAIPPAKTGIYMGIFNMFIVLPEICSALFFGWTMSHLLGNNRVVAVFAGGCFLAVAAGLMLFVSEPVGIVKQPLSEIEREGPALQTGPARV